MFVYIKAFLNAEYNLLSKNSFQGGSYVRAELGAGNPWMSHVTVNSTLGIRLSLKLINTFCFFDKFN